MLLVCKYFILYMLYSFLGWLLEVIVTFIKSKKIVNRGFLIGPYCPIYGKGALLIVLLLKKYENDIIALFVMAVVVCSIIEYITSYILEKLFNTRWWDYSNIKFNINGRVCLQNLVAFGIFGVLLLKYVNPFLLNIISSKTDTQIYTITLVFLLFYLADNVISIKIISKFKNISNSVKVDSTEIVTKYVKEEIERNNKILYNRLIEAFPKLEIYRKKYRSNKED